MIKTALIIILLPFAAVASELASKSFGYQIEWTAVGICLTAMIAIWQLRQDSAQKTTDRKLETKRDILFDGVRGMSEANQAFSNLANLNIEFAEVMRLFQVGMAKINVAASVANLRTAKSGKKFTDTLGPRFMHAMTMRIQLENMMSASHADCVDVHKALRDYILSNVVEIGKSMLRAIAAVRTDVGIAEEDEKTFFDAVSPNESLINSTIKKALDRADPK